MESVRITVRKMIACLLPTQDVFYRLLERQTASMRKAQPILLEIANQNKLNPMWLEKIRNIEDECDGRTKAVHEELQIQFITPIDREDISALTKVIDDAVDLIEEAVTLIINFHLDFKYDPDNDMQQMLRITASSIEKVDEAVKLLDGLKEISSLRNEMRDLEHASDRLFEKIQRQEYAVDARAIIRKKDAEPVTAEDIEKILSVELRQRKRAAIAQRLEESVDKCKNVFDVLGNLYLKHT